MYTPRPSLVEGKPLGDHLLSRVWLNAGHEVSRNDKYRFCYVFLLWTRVLQDLSKTYGLERCYTDANLALWLGQPVIDVADLSDQLSEITGVIRCYDPFQGHSGFRAYKAWLRDELGESMCFELLRPMLYRLYDGNWTVFRDLNTITQFLQRLTFVDTAFMDDTLIDDYQSLEHDMANWVYPQTTIDCLAYIVYEWFRDFEIDGLRPHFSSGATRETRRGVGVTQKVLRGVRTMPLVLADTMLSFSSPYFKDSFSLSQKPSAVFYTVPKSMTKRRGISFEPVVHQYYQSALFEGFKAHFMSHPEIGVDLTDQDTSRQMAIEGSRTRKWATIDLSNASDTVTWKLVRGIFSKLPELVRYMDYVRTESVDIGADTIPLQKYAPMGSTMCFPMECTVFAAIASYACHLAGIPQLYRVYGDDIVIDSRAFTHCCDLLHDLHFEVNTSKSFGPTSIFLEACGIEAYNGHDVTPCRISRRFDVIKLMSLSPQQLTGSIEVINRLGEYGLLSARRMLVKDVLTLYVSVPFSGNPAKGIFSNNPGNPHLRSRFNRDTQQLEYLIVEERSKTLPGSECVRYVRTLEEIELRLPEEPFSEGPIRCGSTRSSLRKEWVSDWILSSSD